MTRSSEAQTGTVLKVLSLPRRMLAALVLCGMTPLGGAQAAPVDDVAALAPPAPDYADPANWAAGPAGPGATAALPEGATPAARAPQVDVFYVYPTVFRTETQWNEDPRDAATNKWVDESVIARQAGVFSACCRIYAPRYRSASYKALFTPGYADPAYDLAYTDIERAFDRFLAMIGKDRPFIIAGHSQGAKHIGELLERRIDGKPLQQRMVAAYIIGINIAEGDFGLRFHNVEVCAKPRQTGCVLQWNSLLAGSDLDKVAAGYEKSFTDKQGEVPGKQMVCINPVTFDSKRPSSLSAEAKGAVPGEPGFGPMRPLRSGAVAVRCERGMALVFPAPGLDLKSLSGGVMHYHDFGLFFADIRANAVERTQAWLAAHRSR